MCPSAYLGVRAGTCIRQKTVYTLLETNCSMRRHFNVEYSYQTDYIEMLDAI